MAVRKVVGIALPIAMILFCFLGFLFIPNDPYATNITAKFLEPGGQFPFGTDELGRCEFSRILWAGKTTIGIILPSALIVMIVGSLLGLFMGQSTSGKNVLIDSVLNAVTAIPPIAYLVIFIGIWGNSIPTMLIALTASLILRLIKLVKTLTEIELGKAYVMCAISAGASKPKILLMHILPNITRDIVHFILLSCAEMIMTISGFSLIGLTLGDEVIDWGYMLSSARSYTGLRPELLLYPVAFIFLTSFCFNYLGKQLERGNS